MFLKRISKGIALALIAVCVSSNILTVNALEPTSGTKIEQKKWLVKFKMKLMN